MMSVLKDMIPGADAWPRFERNRVEQFEARFSLVELPESPSVFFAGMAGSRLPVVVSHGEGRAVFASAAQQASAGGHALRRPWRPAERGLSVQPEWIAGRRHRVYNGRRPLFDHDAAPRTCLPQRPDVVAPGRLERARLARFTLAADVPQCPAMGGLTCARKGCRAIGSR
jgi:hypothetical protein